MNQFLMRSFRQPLKIIDLMIMPIAATWRRSAEQIVRSVLKFYDKYLRESHLKFRFQTEKLLGTKSILFHHFQLKLFQFIRFFLFFFVENDEIVSSKYTTILIKSLFVLYFETTKMLIFGVCFILYYLNLSGKNGF